MDRIFNIVKNGNVAEIEIKGDIGGSFWWDDEGKDSANTKDLMRKEIEALKNIEAEEILLKIDSYGGDVHHGMAMVNALKDTNKTINVKYIGYSASAATLFGTIADEVELPENLMVLFHEAQSGTWGTAEEISVAAENVAKINNTALDGYVSQSKKAGKNKTKEELREFLGRAKGRGQWSEASELLEFGLITKSTPVYKTVASAVPTKENLKKFNLPEPPNINNNYSQKQKKMGFFSKDEKLNLLTLGEVTAAYTGKLGKDTELKVVGDAEIKNGSFKNEGFIVEVENNKVVNYTKIAETKETVNIADFKNEFSEIKAENESLKTQLSENAESTNKAIEKLTGVVAQLADKLNETITEGSKIDVPNAENLGNGENVAVDAKAESKRRIEEKKNELKNL